MIGCDKAESFSDLCRSGATTNVKEVCRFTSMQFDDIHCRHCKTGSIH